MRNGLNELTADRSATELRWTALADAEHTLALPYVRGKRRPDVPQPGKTLSVEERVQRLDDNVQRFLARVAARPA